MKSIIVGNICGFIIGIGIVVAFFNAGGGIAIVLSFGLFLVAYIIDKK